MTALSIPCQLTALKNVNDALGDIEQRSGGRLGDAEMRHQAARGAAMSGRDRVARQAVVPRRHARGDHLVALAARRHEMPFVVLALRDVHGIAVAQLRDGEAFPVAERQLGEALVEGISLRRQAEFGARPNSMVCVARPSGLDT